MVASWARCWIVVLYWSDFALNSLLVRGEALHVASAHRARLFLSTCSKPCREIIRTSLDAYLLLQLGQAHLLRRWMKQTFAASCSNGSSCHKRRLTTTARMARLRVTGPIAVRHPFHSFQVLVAIRRYSWASASKVGLQAPDNPFHIHFRLLFWCDSCIAKLPWPHSHKSAGPRNRPPHLCSPRLLSMIRSNSWSNECRHHCSALSRMFLCFGSPSILKTPLLHKLTRSKYFTSCA